MRTCLNEFLRTLKQMGKQITIFNVTGLFAVRLASQSLMHSPSACKELNSYPPIADLTSGSLVVIVWSVCR